MYSSSRRVHMHTKVGARQSSLWRIKTFTFYILWPLCLLVLWLSAPTTHSQTPQQQQHSGINVHRTLRETPDLGFDGAVLTANTQRSPASTKTNTLPLGNAVYDTQNLKIPSHVVSKFTIQASPSGSGFMNKYYYRFRDVVVSKNKVTVYYDPKTFTPPTEELWVDFISGNTTKPHPPTMLAIKGDYHSKNWFYLPIKYVSAETNQPTCTKWVDKPAFLLQVRYSYNIWHTWNEGIMSLFQTFREHGHLPLVNIDEDGNIDEITQGMGDGCPWEFDFLLNKTVQPTSCGPREGLVDRTKCNPTTESWCKKGVMSWRRYGDGPIIIPYTAASLVNIWAHLYSAMTSDIRDWNSIEGACFRDLTIGKTSTLNFYQAINHTGIEKATTVTARVDNVALRVEAMAVFKAFVTTAQREWYNNELLTNPDHKAFTGYKDKGMERLRRGIGPEDIGALDAIVPGEVPGMLREEVEELKELAAASLNRTEAALHKFIEEFGGAAPALRLAEEAERLGKNKKLPGTKKYEDDEAEAAAAKLAIDHPELAAALVQREEEEEAPEVQAYIYALPSERASQENTEVKEGGIKWEEGHLAKSRSYATRMWDIDGKQTADRVPNKKDTGVDAAELTVSVSRKLLARPSVFVKANHKPFFDKEFVYHHEEPRPVVTYACRNFFSRGVLNEKDVLEYILQRYNVTLRVTTFEEPLLEVMETLGETDVFFGMHGAGWTNGLFIKRGATTLQMYPYGWRLPTGQTLRGYNYREIVLASESPYMEWVSQNRTNAFFRRIDFVKKQANDAFTLHPLETEPLPTDVWPGNSWIYQNTYVDMESFGPYIDQMMAKANIRPMRR